ncbi:MAG: hypothetical protein EXR73_06210 [Myxococcales bacterium]|nr:hypothetical protein [Myxococcales bacterium]
MVTLDPKAAEADKGELIVHSDDPDAPTISVALNSVVEGAPELSIPLGAGQVPAEVLVLTTDLAAPDDEQRVPVLGAVLGCAAPAAETCDGCGGTGVHGTFSSAAITGVTTRLYWSVVDGYSTGSGSYSLSVSM